MQHNITKDDLKESILLKNIIEALHFKLSQRKATPLSLKIVNTIAAWTIRAALLAARTTARIIILCTSLVLATFLIARILLCT